MRVRLHYQVVFRFCYRSLGDTIFIMDCFLLWFVSCDRDKMLSLYNVTGSICTSLILYARRAVLSGLVVSFRCWVVCGLKACALVWIEVTWSLYRYMVLSG